MTKGYWIAHVDIDDPAIYQNYVAANAAAFAAYGARFLVRASEVNEQVEGTLRSRHVVLEFPTYEAAVACYRSEAYQAAKDIRSRASVGDIVIFEGYDGAQPGD